MPPQGPFIKTTYKPDGTMVKEPQGYGGPLCQIAVAPYATAHGGFDEVTPTAEALERPCLERPTIEEEPNREHA